MLLFSFWKNFSAYWICKKKRGEKEMLKYTSSNLESTDNRTVQGRIVRNNPHLTASLAAVSCPSMI